MLSISLKAWDITNNLSKMARKKKKKKRQGLFKQLITVNFHIPDKEDTNFLLQLLAPIYNIQYFPQEDKKKKKYRNTKK